eukprot:3390497-Rhodomonas_salina.2
MQEVDGLPSPWSSSLNHAAGAIYGRRVISVPMKWAQEKNACKGTRVPHMCSWSSGLKAGPGTGRLLVFASATLRGPATLMSLMTPSRTRSLT